MRNRRAVISALTTTVACVLPVFLAGGLAVQAGAELGFSPAGLGVAVAGYFAVSALTSVPAGRVVERFGPTVTARVAIVLAAVSLAAVGMLARSLLAFATLLAIGGVANALGQLASNASLALHVSPGRQGLSFGAKQAAIPVSTLLAGAAVPTVALTVGWRWAFVAAAVAVLLAVPLVPADPRTGSGNPRRAAARASRGATAALAFAGVAAMLAAGAANAMGAFLVDSAASRGIDPGLAGLTLALGGAVSVAARLAVGWFADRRPDGHVGMVAGMMAAGSLGIALLAVPSSVALVVGVVLGFGLGWSWPGLLTFAVVKLHPQAPAAATSISQTGVYAGGFVGPLGFGALAASIGYPPAWVLAALAMVLAAILMLLASRALHRTVPTPA